MPNRYEREIEEILRNLEQTEPGAGQNQKFGDRLRRKRNVRRSGNRRPISSPHFTTSEWLLITSVIAALIAGGYAYLQPKPDPITDIITGVLACVSLVCLILVALSHFVFNRSRVQPSRYGNVTITPLHGNIFSNIKTQWNLLMLKMRYRRRNRP
jgi:hypothetical protein